jgi:2'-5' RNA ligase
METKRLFFALWPDDRQRELLREVINSVAKTVEGHAVDRRNWHITLAWIGDYPADRVPQLLQRASEIQFEPFRLSFDRLEFWARPRIASLTAATVPEEMHELVSSLENLLQDEGVVKESRTYRPHITVSRNARTFETERLAHRTSIEWSSFDLVESVPGRGGAFYRPLKQ